jgi:hypothetical protein
MFEGFRLQHQSMSMSVNPYYDPMVKCRVYERLSTTVEVLDAKHSDRPAIWGANNPGRILVRILQT